MAASGSASDPLQLEHVIGYTGRHANNLALHHKHETGFVYGLGANVVLADVTDPHEQIFLRGHSADVAAVDLSSSGILVASGQVKIPGSATEDAPVMVWDTRSRTRVFNFLGLTGVVNCVRMTPDEQFLAASATDLGLCIWDLSTGELLFGRKLGSPSGAAGPGVAGIAILQWTHIDRSQRRPKYHLAFNVFDRIHVAVVEYDYKVMKYRVELHAAAIPSSGFARVYTCGGFDPATSSLLCGTTAGELVAFAMSPLPVFKGAVQASSHGVHSIYVAPPTPAGAGTVVFCGGGDGTVRSFCGRDAAWAPVGDAVVLGRVITMSPAASGSWLLVGTEMGHIYRVSWGTDLSSVPRGVRGAADLIEASHVAAVNMGAFVQGASTAIATAGCDGSLRYWSLETYDMKWVCYTGAAAPLCVWADKPMAGVAAPGMALPDESLPIQLYAGFSDGSLRGYDVLGRNAADGKGAVEAFKVVAHKGGVTSVVGNRVIIVTGGADARVCVWSRKGHDLMYSFSEHTKPVACVLTDGANIELLYSLAGDRLLNTYNLRAERRMKVHSFPRGDSSVATFTCLAQNPDPSSERELFTGTNDGRIFCWDVDVPDVCVGVVDLLKLLPAEYVPRMSSDIVGPAAPASVSAARARSSAAGLGAAYVTGAGTIGPRPDLKINSIACSPSGKLMAVATQSALVVILEMGKSGTAIVPPSGIAARGALPKLSSIGDMTLLSVFQGLSPYTHISWSADERQLVATALDGCISVFNWYGLPR